MNNNDKLSQNSFKLNGSETIITDSSNPLNKLFEFVANLGPSSTKIKKHFTKNSNLFTKCNYDNHLKEEISKSELEYWRIPSSSNSNNCNNNNNNQSNRNNGLSSHSDILKCTTCAKRCRSLEELAAHKQKTGHIR